MSSTRRIVRATPRFFEDLDRQLRSERGPNGEPSTNDSQVFELIRIVDRFAAEFDDLSRLIAERDDYRILVMSGTLVAGFSVIGQLAADGAVRAARPRHRTRLVQHSASGQSTTTAPTPHQTALHPASSDTIASGRRDTRPAIADRYHRINRVWFIDAAEAESSARATAPQQHRRRVRRAPRSLRVRVVRAR